MTTTSPFDLGEFGPHGTLFSNRNALHTLIDCLDQEFRPTFMPELADLRISRPTGDSLWTHKLMTSSLCVTGKNSRGTPLIVYAHVPVNFLTYDAYFSFHCSPHYGLPLEQKEFERLLALDEVTDTVQNRLVYVLPYRKPVASGTFELDHALEHPHLIPFFASESRARAYLAQHKQIFGDHISLWFDHTNHPWGTPSAFPLRVGNLDRSLDCHDCCGLSSTDLANCQGTVLAFPSSLADKQNQNTARPSLSDIVGLASLFIPLESERIQFEANLYATYLQNKDHLKK